MRSLNRSMIMVVALGSMALAGCKKTPDAPPPPQVAPADDEPEYDEPEYDEPEYDEPDDTPPRPSARSWPHVTPDQGAPAPRVTPPPKVQRRAISTDADIAQAKQEQDRVDTEKAVERSVNGALSRVKSCFDRHKVSAGSRKLHVRVHRSGRVLSSSVTGVSAEVNRCVEKALGRLHVPEMKTDTIDVERDLNFTR